MQCRKCRAGYQTVTNGIIFCFYLSIICSDPVLIYFFHLVLALTEAIDVYHEWIDAIDEADKK